MEHECKLEWQTEKIDECSGVGVNKCYGTSPMIFEVWHMAQDGTECYYDDWIIVHVEFCPFCGLPAQPERSKREESFSILQPYKWEKICGALNSMET